jgi:histone acetyltransferase SAS3
VFEVDGRKNPVYCQNLCLLAKLFLGSKTLYYDVEPFLFYVMTESDQFGCHFVGYFSKEKRNTSMNNVSCILTLPVHQRKGYGNLLIDFSYLLTRAEKKTGSPEKPLSDMGLVSYRNYWRLIMCYELINQTEPVSTTELSQRTGMTPDDVISALEGLHALVRDPLTGIYALRLDHKLFKQVIDKWESKGYVTLRPQSLIWTPFVQGRSLTNIDNVPISTVAPRDDDIEEDEEEEGVPGTFAIRDEAISVASGQGLANGINGTPSRRFGSASPFDSNGVARSIENGDATPKVHINGVSFDQDTVMDLNGEANTIVRPPSQPSPPKEEELPYKLPSGESVVRVEGVTYTVPASQFEIYPPLPTAPKPKTPGQRGRPPLRGRRKTTALAGTPRQPKGLLTPNDANGSALRRSSYRARSKLGEDMGDFSSTMTNGFNEDSAGGSEVADTMDIDHADALQAQIQAENEEANGFRDTQIQVVSEVIVNGEGDLTNQVVTMETDEPGYAAEAEKGGKQVEVRPISETVVA